VKAEVVDSHHHLWDPAALRYSLFETVEELNRPYTLAQFDSEAEQLGIGQSICVEAASAGADGRLETEWLLREIEESLRVTALVAWAPLEQAYIERYLDWLTSLRGKPVVGVRRGFELEPDDFPKQATVIGGARLAGERGLVVDLVLFARSLEATITLVEMCPETQFVLDHLGKPLIRDGQREPWAGQLRELASFPNVVCKLSGLATEADRKGWTTDDLRPYVEHTFECFGPSGSCSRPIGPSLTSLAALNGGSRPPESSLHTLIGRPNWRFSAPMRAESTA
jgi:predicted TIM-barrel fold metal-dependent hydrolase